METIISERLAISPSRSSDVEVSRPSASSTLTDISPSWAVSGLCQAARGRLSGFSSSFRAYSPVIRTRMAAFRNMVSVTWASMPVIRSIFCTITWSITAPVVPVMAEICRSLVSWVRDVSMFSWLSMEARKIPATSSRAIRIRLTTFVSMPPITRFRNFFKSYHSFSGSFRSVFFPASFPAAET